MFGRLKQLSRLLDLSRKLGPLLRELVSTAWPILAAIAATVADAYADGTLGFAAGTLGVFGVGLTLRNLVEVRLVGPPAYAAELEPASYVWVRGSDPAGGSIYMRAGVTFPPGPPDSYDFAKGADPDACDLPPLQLGEGVILDGRLMHPVRAIYKFGPDGVGRWVPVGDDCGLYFRRGAEGPGRCGPGCDCDGPDPAGDHFADAGDLDLDYLLGDDDVDEDDAATAAA